MQRRMEMFAADMQKLTTPTARLLPEVGRVAVADDTSGVSRP